MRPGLPGSSPSHGIACPGMRRCDTEKPTSPALGLAPRPVAPSSRISPPEPVAAPGYGEIAVGMVVRLALDDDMGRFLFVGDTIRRRRKKPHGLMPVEDRAVVGVGQHRALRVRRMRVADHREQRLRLARAVDDPVRVEDLVAAVLRIGLREHGELGVGRVAPEAAVGALEVLDLVLAQRQAELAVGFADVGNKLQRPRRYVLEQATGVVEGAQHGLGHAVVQQSPQSGGIFESTIKRGAPLDALHAREAAVARDVARLRGPRRNGAEARHHQVERARSGRRRRRAVVEQPLEQAAAGGVELALGFHEVAQLRGQRTHSGIGLAQGGEQLGEAGLRQRPRASELEDALH